MASLGAHARTAVLLRVSHQLVAPARAAEVEARAASCEIIIEIEKVLFVSVVQNYLRFRCFTLIHPHLTGRLVLQAWGPRGYRPGDLLSRKLGELR